MPDAIRHSAELQLVFVPILPTGVSLLETYDYVAGEPLDCPGTVLGGKSNPAISAVMLAGWEKLTSASFAQHEFSGGHFFIHAEREEVVVEGLARSAY